MTTGTISGTVKVGTDDGAPASNSTVRAYDRDTGALVAETISDLDGAFYMSVPDSTKTYIFTAINNLFPGYNAGIKDNVSTTSSLPTLIVTSGVYPLYMDDDQIILGASFIGAQTISFFSNEGISLAASFVLADLVTTIVYKYYTDWPKEEINLSSSFISAILTDTITYFYYTTWPAEEVSLSSSFISAELTVVINYLYNTMLTEEVSLSTSFIGATLA